MSLAASLSPAQWDVVTSWFPGAEPVADHSWGLTDTVVLHLRHGGRDLILKASGPDNHHLVREITAHEGFTGPLVEAGRVGRMLHADRELRLLVLEHLPGRLVEGSPAEGRPETYRQAGELLALLHAQGSRVVPDFEAAADARALAWLEQPHRIAPATVARLREILREGERRPAVLVPTHGDWQPRNWLVDDAGAVRVIDFGRFDWRPAATDLARLAVQQFVGRPDLAAAYLDGYGGDPRDPDGWRLIQVREAIGTAAWAYQVGDEAFEQQGHRMIADALRA